MAARDAGFMGVALSPACENRVVAVAAVHYSDRKCDHEGASLDYSVQEITVLLGSTRHHNEDGGESLRLWHRSLLSRIDALLDQKSGDSCFHPDPDCLSMRDSCSSARCLNRSHANCDNDFAHQSLAHRGPCYPCVDRFYNPRFSLATSQLSSIAARQCVCRESPFEGAYS